MAKMLRSTDRNRTPITASNADLNKSRDGAAAGSPRRERELAHRHNDGLDVTLVWRPGTNELAVRVLDQRQDARFEVRPAHDMALEVYRHPYAYLALADEVLAS